MDFALSVDQRAIQEATRSFLGDTAGSEVLRAAVDGPTGYDEALWQGLCAMGFPGLMIPEAYGGLGLGAIEMALVLEELGRVLAPVPYFETAVLAVQAILRTGDEHQKGMLLARIAEGARVSFAGTDRRPVLRDGHLTGTASFVTNAQVANLFVIATADGSLIVLEPGTPGVNVTRLPSLDPTRRMAQLDFDCAVASDLILGAPGAAAATIDDVLTLGGGLLAAEQTGAAQFSIDATVEYSLQRVQFGRQIGSFQAYKHMVADMTVLVEASRSAAYYAAAAIDEQSDEFSEACHVARSYAADAFRAIAADAIQLHGGIGFTWEHHAHLYFKRARASATWLGTSDQHREKLAAILLDKAA